MRLGEQFVVDSNVALGGAADDNRASRRILLVIVDLACRWSSENFQLKLDGAVFCTDIQVLWDVQLLVIWLLQRSCSIILHELLKVLVLLDQAACDDVDYDVGFSNIDQHVIFQHDWRLLAHKNSIADAQILDQEVVTLHVVHDLEVATAVLLCSLFVLVRNDKVVHDPFLHTIKMALVIY